MRNPWSAGVWEQYREDDGGDGLAVRSHHRTLAAAIRAAVRYARECMGPTGGARSWSGGVRAPDGTVTWYRRDGEVER